MARSPPFAEHGTAGIDNVRKGESPYMTVQNQNVKNVYRGNGSTTVFPFTFAINESHPEYIHVYITNDGGKAVETEDFTCDMETRTITYPKVSSSAPKLSATQRLTIYRLLPYEQNLNLVNQGPFFSEDVETQLDDLEMQIQQLNESDGRSLKISNDTSTDRPTFDLNVPIEAGKTFRVNDDGTGFVPCITALDIKAAAEAARDAAQTAQGYAEDAETDAENFAVAENAFTKRTGNDHTTEYRSSKHYSEVATSAAETAAEDTIAATRDLLDAVLEEHSDGVMQFDHNFDIMPCQFPIGNDLWDVNADGSLTPVQNE